MLGREPAFGRKCVLMVDVSNRRREPSGTTHPGAFAVERKGLDADDLTLPDGGMFAPDGGLTDEDERFLAVTSDSEAIGIALTRDRRDVDLLLAGNPNVGSGGRRILLERNLDRSDPLSADVIRMLMRTAGTARENPTG